MDSGAAGARGGVAFGPFRLYAGHRLLERDGVPIAIGSRALDLLIALVERAGDVVGKQELMARVWPNITVDESSLRVHVAILRKVLADGRDGARYVTNVSGRGYCFVASVASVMHAPAASLGKSAAAAPSPRLSAALPPTLPRQLGRMIGRTETLRELSQLLSVHRFVTLHGPGGVGKTTVAVALANAELIANAVAFVDLGAIGDPKLVGSAIASALGVAVQSGDALPTLLNFLRPRRLLLVLDNCEHVIDSVARFAEPIFREAVDVSLLVTSRESLRVEGEHVHQLPALATPPQGNTLAASDVLGYAAASLFVERAAAGGHQVDLSDADAAIVAEICRKLDGNALAIELAAGRVATHGLAALAELLDSRLRLSWQGRRTAGPRHQTLHATLDWSHNLISENERTVLRRLSVLVGGFTLQAAQAVASDDSLDDGTVIETLEQLVAKSLVNADTAETPPRYRLLETMRVYAWSKLAESGEEHATVRRHAAFYSNFLEETRSARTRSTTPGRGRIERASLLGNVRAALDRCFSKGGDRALGVEVAAAAVPLFIEVSLLAECRHWSEQAMSVLDTKRRGTRIEMELQAALGHSLMLTSSNSDEAGAAMDCALEIAVALGDLFNQFRILNRLHLYHRRIGEAARTLEVAQQMVAVADEIGDPAGRAGAHTQLGLSYHLVGDQGRARLTLEGPAAAPPGGRPTDPGHFAFHRAPSIPLSRVLWLQGYPDQALEIVDRLAGMPLADDDPVTSCIALIWCASVYGWAGDWTTVGQQADRLIIHADAHFLVPYRNVGLGLRAEVLVQRGVLDEGIGLLRHSIASLDADRYRLYTPGFTATLATALAAAGQAQEAEGVIEDMVAEVEATNGRFILPELLRVWGEIRVVMGDERKAQSLFRRALALAEEQAALSWQLRVAASLARLAQQGRKRVSAQDLLADIYSRFSEGFATTDLKSAKELLRDRPRRRR